MAKLFLNYRSVAIYLNLIVLLHLLAECSNTECYLNNEYLWREMDILSREMNVNLFVSIL